MPPRPEQPIGHGPGRSVPSSSEVRRLLRASTVLDPLVRRQWLRVVDHLTPDDRLRLAAILREAQQDAAPVERTSASL